MTTANKSSRRAIRSLAENYRVIRSYPGLAALLPGVFINSLGGAMVVVSVAWLALEIAPSGYEGAWVALCLGALYVPGIVGRFALSRLFAVLDGRAIIVLDAFVRAASYVLIVVTYHAGGLSGGVYLGLLAVGSVTAPWARGGLHEIVATTVGAEDRLAANSWLMAQGSIATIVGPAVGGIVAAAANPAVVFACAALAAATLMFVVILSVRRRPSSVPSSRARGSLTSSGWAAIRSNSVVLHLLILTFCVGFLFGFLEVALPLYVLNSFGSNALGLGAMWSLFGAGAVLGSFLSTLYGRLQFWTAAVLTTALWAVAITLVGLAPGFALATAFMASAGVVYAPYQAVASTFIQTSFSSVQLPSVGAAWSSIMMVAAPVGYFVGGPLLQVLSPRTVVVISGVATLAVALGGVLLGWLRRREGRIEQEMPGHSFGAE
ncbi:MFS transporter [Pseudonocardia sp. EV170527-09]|uniref:MFS transporter n=1 Tax=Pseudonocardia sp. EV170527-09 TaxID=2603411 RepID=UPI0011F3BD01|nr:MFS transporter [Pseudonocardia sp. EV170527-09]KAA1018366.1 MFS transporter [Pseudonocardia sp. EV170527-09]